MERDWRCSESSILLARIGDHELTIRRNELQATMTGEFHASVVCYRPRCRTLNVLRIRSKPAEADTTR
jgi:phage FluMu protein Com